MNTENKKTHPMKKIALLSLTALFMFGVQSCSIDEQEDIAPQKILTPEKTEAKNLKLPSGFDSGCTKVIYVNFGEMSASDRSLFRFIAAQRWYDSIALEETLCSNIEIWHVPCDLYYNPKNDETKKVVVDAEESMTLGEGGAAQPPYTGPAPIFERTDAPLAGCIPNGPNTDPLFPDGDNNGDDDDTGGGPIGIPLR